MEQEELGQRTLMPHVLEQVELSKFIVEKQSKAPNTGDPYSQRESRGTSHSRSEVSS